MTLELTELTWLGERAEYTLVELAEHSRLAEAEILELIECGIISLRDSHALTAAKTAARLHNDFEIDLQGVALAMTLLKRIQELEAELGQLRARVPRAP